MVTSASTASAFLRVANIVALVATLLINGMANTTLLGGKTTGQISDLYPTLVTPAGYVFSIWSVIYILLLVFVVFQAMPKNRERPFHKEIGYLFVLSCVINIIWLFLWQYQQMIISVPLMLGLLGSLIAIYLRLNIGKSGVPLKERISVHLPFSVYLGWITVATIANISVALVSVGWGSLGIAPTSWAVLVTVVAVLITLIVIATRKDIAYSLVLIWALAGIMMKQAANQTVAMTAGISAVVIAVGLIAAILSVFKIKKMRLFN
jgi:benzodiazapine receptor